MRLTFQQQEPFLTSYDAGLAEIRTYHLPDKTSGFDTWYVRFVGLETILLLTYLKKKTVNNFLFKYKLKVFFTQLTSIVFILIN